MLPRSISGFRALPIVIAAACVALLQPVANATEAGFRQMTVTASTKQQTMGSDTIVSLAFRD